MKLDLYSKSVLTVIAICLTINVLKDFDIMPKAYANEPLKNEIRLLPNKNYGLIPVNPDGSIDVNIKSSTTMDVNIESCDSYALQYAGPMKVDIRRNDDK
ncbi:hypothetical protein [Chryseobacterium sp. SC28]|uniref:hypothetical protein n=1 Tax=Chryseobacterium sp. SC28 TaxID=2268028 RepID=UPI001628F819|nr:hypothetical protein [Chryseobacterium sp. SC28]